MLKAQLYILKEKLFSPLSVLFNPVVRLLKVSFCREKKDNLHLTPTGKDPCLGLFPGDDLIGIVTVFFKTPIEFVQLLLGDRNCVGIGR